MKKPGILLDSGAFTAFKTNRKIDIDEYAEFVEQNQDVFDGCFNLDVIHNAEASYQNWKYLKQNGINTIPVYHNQTDPKYLVRYLDKTDFIGIGAIANLNTTRRITHLDNLWKKYLIDPKTGKARLKVHGLGLTQPSIMAEFPWYSVDSFTPPISAVWGRLLLPAIVGKDKFDYFNYTIPRISDQCIVRTSTAGDYLNLPQLHKDQYERLFKSYGFELGQITYQRKRIQVKRKDKSTSFIEPMFDVSKPADENVRTLANDWKERMRWNLIVWTKVQKVIPDVITYMGVSTIPQLEVYNMVEPKIPLLISYAYMTDKIWPKIKKYAKESSRQD